jgi:hypothetical protein
MRKALFRRRAAAMTMAAGGKRGEAEIAVFTPDEMTHQIVMKPGGARERGCRRRDPDRHLSERRARAQPGPDQDVNDGIADIAWVILSYTPGVYLETTCSSCRT